MTRKPASRRVGKVVRAWTWKWYDGTLSVRRIHDNKTMPAYDSMGNRMGKEDGKVVPVEIREVLPLRRDSKRGGGR